MKMRLLVLAAALLWLTGCAVTMGAHTPSIDTAVALRDPTVAPLSVGDFRLAAGLDPAIDRSQSSRGNPIHPPSGGTFSGYLRESLLEDLKAAGKYDANAPLAVAGELTDNSLSTGMSEGHASVAARFKVTRGDEVLYNKVLRQEQHWPSSFVGAIAIPDAINHYTAQFGDLLEQLYQDGDFRKAVHAEAARH